MHSGHFIVLDCEMKLNFQLDSLEIQGILGNSGKCREIQGILGNSGKCMEIQGIPGNTREIWEMRGNAGKFWEFREIPWNSGKCREIQGNAGKVIDKYILIKISSQLNDPRFTAAIDFEGESQETEDGAPN